MKEVEKEFLECLKCALLKQPLSFTTCDYQNLLLLANDQLLYPIVFEQLDTLDDFRQIEQYSVYKKSYKQKIIIQIQKTQAFLMIYQEFVKAHIHPILLKGLLCRKTYGSLEEYRMSSDEDIYITLDEYSKVKDILINNGYYLLHGDNVDLKKVQAIGFSNGILNIEVHINVIGYGNDLREQMNDYFRDLDEYESISIQNVSIRTLTKTKHYLFLIMHCFKHFTTCGVGIRQILDILLWKQMYQQEIDFQYIEKSLKEVDAYLFYQDLLYIGNQYLGFHNNVQIVTATQEMLEDIFDGGIYGHNSPQRTMSGALVNMYYTHHSKNKWLNYFHAIFPSIHYFENDFPILKDKPYLLIYFWIRRWFRFIKRLNNKEANLKGISISQKRIKMLNQYGVKNEAKR